ncbi:MAG: hypothetical protein R2695_01755 [Acidimicrobiales bacterium]
MLVDGNWDFVESHPTTLIVKGDAVSLSIAAASIVAKVTCDRLMRGYDALHPPWGGFANKGYLVPATRPRWAAHGPSAVHRRRWAFMDDSRWTAIPWIVDDDPQLGLFDRAEVAANGRAGRCSSGSPASGNIAGDDELTGGARIGRLAVAVMFVGFAGLLALAVRRDARSLRRVLARSCCGRSGTGSCAASIIAADHPPGSLWCTSSSRWSPRVWRWAWAPPGRIVRDVATPVTFLKTVSETGRRAVWNWNRSSPGMGRALSGRRGHSREPPARCARLGDPRDRFGGVGAHLRLDGHGHAGVDRSRRPRCARRRPVHLLRARIPSEELIAMVEQGGISPPGCDRPTGRFAR